MVEIPLLVSVDDHVIEPKDLWERHIDPKFRDDERRFLRHTPSNEPASTPGCRLAGTGASTAALLGRRS